MGFLSFVLLIFPTVKTLQVLRKPKSQSLAHWLIFWFIYGLLDFGSFVLSWIPLTGFFGTIFVLLLYSETFTISFRKYVIVPAYRDLRKVASNSDLLTQIREKGGAILNKIWNWWQNFQNRNEENVGTVRVILRYCSNYCSNYFTSD
jgi:hypothetical protein